MTRDAIEDIWSAFRRAREITHNLRERYRGQVWWDIYVVWPTVAHDVLTLADNASDEQRSALRDWWDAAAGDETAVVIAAVAIGWYGFVVPGTAVMACWEYHSRRASILCASSGRLLDAIDGWIDWWEQRDIIRQWDERLKRSGSVGEI